MPQSYKVRDGEGPPMVTITIDGSVQDVFAGERLIDVLNRIGAKVPQICYHDQLGPIETCDTCLVEVDGKLIRSCAAVAAQGMRVLTKSAAAVGAHARRLTGSLPITCCIARFVITTTAIALPTTRPSCWRWSIRTFHSCQSRTKWTIAIRSIGTIRASVFFVGVALRLVRMWR